MEDYFRVGVIANTHGIRGEVKVFPTTEDPKRFKGMKEIILDTGNEKKVLEVASARFFKNMVILKFKGIDSINDIEKYKGRDLLVTRENAIPLEEGEYYIADILGATVVTEDGEKFGVMFHSYPFSFIMPALYNRALLLPKSKILFIQREPVRYASGFPGRGAGKAAGFD